jgi:hypothetical protein
MRTIRRITGMTIVVLSAMFCLAQFSPKKQATVCNEYQQQTTTASFGEAEDFSLISLLTLKFM